MAQVFTVADWQANDYSGPMPNVLNGGFVLIPPEPTNVPGFTGWHVVIRGAYIAIFPNWPLAEGSVIGYSNNQHERYTRWPPAFMKRWNLIEIPGVIGIAMSNGPLIPSGPPVLPPPNTAGQAPPQAPVLPVLPATIGNAPAAPAPPAVIAPPPVIAPAPVVAPAPVIGPPRRSIIALSTGSPAPTQAAPTRSARAMSKAPEDIDDSDNASKKATRDPPPNNNGSSSRNYRGSSVMDWYPVGGDDSDIESIGHGVSSSSSAVTTTPVVEQSGSFLAWRGAESSTVRIGWGPLHKVVKAYFSSHNDYTRVSLLTATRVWGQVQGDVDMFLAELLRRRAPAPTIEFCAWALGPEIYDSE